MTTIYLSDETVQTIYDYLDENGKIPAIKYVRDCATPIMALGLRECKAVVDQLILQRHTPERYHSYVDRDDGTNYVGVSIGD